MVAAGPSPRALIARLAAAVIAADGRITDEELDALEHLDALGLGPLSDVAEEEVRRARHRAIDVLEACAGLRAVSPHAAALIFAALSDMAAADGELSAGELQVLHTVAEAFELSPDAERHILEAAAASHGAGVSRDVAMGLLGAARVRAARARPAAVAVRWQGQAPPEPTTTPDGELGQAYRLLGVEPSARQEEVDAAYAALLARYDPLKVIELGPEFAVLAVRKLRVITHAFEVVRGALARAG